MVARLINCTDCGHCIDLHAPAPTDSPELTAVRDEIASTIKQWLAEDLLKR